MNRVLLFAVFLTGIFSASLPAQTESDRLIIATKASPPFSMEEDGVWTGLAIDLWEEIATAAGWIFEYRELPIEEMLQGLEDGTVDVAVAPLSITPDRESRIDFSHSYFRGGLGLAVMTDDTPGWVRGLQSLLSVQFLQAIFALSVILLLAGAAVWLFERKANPDQFGGGVLRGLGSSFWWSAVTMTTVGYGDKAPVSLGGRVVALIWMFVSIITISGFTAAIATAVTVGSLGSLSGKSPSEMVFATVEETSSESYAAILRFRSLPKADLDAAFEAVRTGEADAVLYDRPILLHVCGPGNLHSDFSLRLNQLTSEDYGFGLQENSSLREALNLEILRVTESQLWKDLKFKYLGEE